VEPEPFTSALIQGVALLLVVRALDLWEREPLKLLALLALWGAAGATAIAAPGNAAVEAVLSPDVAVVFGPAISAPIVEELAKGAALLAVFLASGWVARRIGVAEFDGPVDGMVYGAAVGLGFAFAENNVYFLNEAYETGNLVAGLQVLELREGFLNLQTLSHGVYSAAFGAGLGLATWSRTPGARIGFPLLGLALAMALHALHNGLISLVLASRYGLDTTAAAFRGEPLPADVADRMTATVNGVGRTLELIDYALIAAFLAGIVVWVRYQRRVMAFELAAERDDGLLTREEYDLVSRYGRRLAHYLRLLLAGRLHELRSVHAAHQQLAELAFLKWRIRTVGGDTAAVDRQRARVRALRA